MNHTKALEVLHDTAYRALLGAQESGNTDEICAAATEYNAISSALNSALGVASARLRVQAGEAEIKMVATNSERWYSIVEAICREQLSQAKP